ncbi:MAG: hypothetical protein M3O46_16390 [Myxococcota bacterium]|nr:hypothetical protein [Myxococcota bacterium]
MATRAHVDVWLWLAGSALVTAAVAPGCAVESNATSSGAGVGPLPPSDAATFPGDASACRPGDVETYQPGAYHRAAGAWQGVCSPAQITGFYDMCLGPQKSKVDCDGFVSAMTTGPCAACILTPEGASHDGPLINHGGFLTANIAGCIELTDSSGLSCAKALQALGGCELAACKANCPVHDSPSRMAYDACAVQADSAGCRMYDPAATCIYAEPDAGLTTGCLQQTFPEFYAAVVPLFCGAPPDWLEGGTPPQFDASSDAGRPPTMDSSSSVDATLDATTTDSAMDVRSDAPGDARAGDARLDAPGDAAKE